MPPNNELVFCLIDEPHHNRECHLVRMITPLYLAACEEMLQVFRCFFFENNTNSEKIIENYYYEKTERINSSIIFVVVPKNR